MATKPAREKFQQRVNESEKRALERKRADGTVQESMEKYRMVFETAKDAIFFSDETGKIADVNPAACELLGYTKTELLKRCTTEMAVDPRESEAFIKLQDGLMDRIRYETNQRRKDGTLLPVEIIWNFFESDGKRMAIAIARDLTERKRAEDALTKIRKQLALRTRRLKEANTALKVLLKTREEDKIEIEERLLHNVKEVIFPYIEGLKKARLNGRQIELLSIIESNLNEITSPLVRKLSSTYFRLTPTELRIAKLVKDGKSTLEIAELLNSSDRTIERHRQNIRKKIGIKNTRANLRSMLASL